MNIGAPPIITSASSTNAFTYGTAGTTFTVTTTGVPTPSLSESGSFPSWATVKDNGDGTATISGSPTDAGMSTFTITAHNGYGTDATQSFTLTVNKATVTPSITASNKVYDGTTTASVTCSLTGVVTCSAASANFSDKNVANSKTVTATGITLGGSAAGNYTLSAMTATTTANITQRPLTVTATGVDKQYDGTTTATVTLSDNRVSGDVFMDSYTNATFSDKNVGMAKTVTVSGISISGTDAGNYSLSNITATTTANITARPLTVTATGVNKTYDGTTAATVILSDNRVSGDVFTDSYTSATFSDANAGNGKTVKVSGISISGPDAGNYTFNTTTTTTANITAAPPVVTVTGGPFTYDGNPHPTVVAAIGVNSYVVPGTFAVVYTPPGNTTVPVNAGTYSVSATFGSTDPNYTGAVGTGSITINQATPAFSNLISPTIPYGTATTQLEGTISLGSLYPTGNVSITLNSVTQATINPDGTFSASFNTGALMVSGSPYAITYHYGGDAHFTAISPDGTGTLTVNQATTTTALVSGTNPSILGQSVTLTATVTDASGTGVTPPDGTVTFYDGTALLGTASVTSGVAAFSTADLTVVASPHSITAVYGRDANFSASAASSAVPQTVNTRPTSTTVALAPSSVAVQIPSTPHDHRHGRGDYRTFGTGGTWGLRACGQHLEYRP